MNHWWGNPEADVTYVLNAGISRDNSRRVVAFSDISNKRYFVGSPCAVGMRLESAKIDLSGMRQLGHSRTCFSWDDVAVCHVRSRCIHYERDFPTRPRRTCVYALCKRRLRYDVRKGPLSIETQFRPNKVDPHQESPYYAPNALQCFSQRTRSWEVRSYKEIPFLSSSLTLCVFLSPGNFRS